MIHSPSPRPAYSVASVTTNAFTPAFVTKSAFTTPHSAPITRIAPNTAGREAPAIAIFPATAAETNMTAPTDRSIPAVSRTNVMPVATIPTEAHCTTMFTRLAGSRKRGERRAKTSPTPARMTSAG